MPSTDRERFEMLFRTHFDAVLRYAATRAPEDVAKDAVAQTFLVAWRRLADVPDRPLPWLLGVTRRTLADQRRSARRVQQLRERIPPSDSSPDVAVDAAERRIVLDAFSRLRPADREVLQLVAWDGQSHDDAGAVLGCSGPTFAVRLSRARSRFEAALAAADATDDTDDADDPDHATPINLEAR